MEDGRLSAYRHLELEQVRGGGGEGERGREEVRLRRLCELRLIYLNHVAAQEGFYVLISRT